MLNFPELDVDLIGFVHIQDQSMHHPTSCFHSKGERVVVSTIIVSSANFSFWLVYVRPE